MDRIEKRGRLPLREIRPRRLRKVVKQLKNKSNCKPSLVTVRL